MWIVLYVYICAVTVAFAATTLPLSRKIYQAEEKRNADTKERETAIGLSNYLNIVYFGTISIGTPRQLYRVLFNTGSGDFWLPNKECKGACEQRSKYNHARSKTYNAVGKSVTIKYTIGTVMGYASRDDVRVGGLEVKNQTFVEATKVTGVYRGIEGYDGVLGLAFEPTAFSKTTPFFQNAIKHGLINPVFGLYLTNNNAAMASQLTFGGVNPRLFKGQVTYANLTQERYWEFQLILKIKGKSLCKKSCLVKSDSGDSLMSGRISNEINKNLGATYFRRGLYNFDCAKLSDLPPVTFVISGVSFTMTSEQYVVKNIFDGVCLSGFRHYEVGAVDLNLGDPFLRAFYSVHDAGGKKIGFATSRNY